MMPGYLRMFLDFYDLFEKHSMARYYEKDSDLTRLEVWYLYLWYLTNTETLTEGVDEVVEIIYSSCVETLDEARLSYGDIRERLEEHGSESIRAFIQEVLELIAKQIGVEKWQLGQDQVNINSQMCITSSYLMMPYVLSPDVYSDKFWTRDGVQLVEFSRPAPTEISKGFTVTNLNELWETGMRSRTWTWWVIRPPQREYGIRGGTSPDYLLADLKEDLKFPETTYMFAYFSSEREFQTFFAEHPEAFQAYVKLLLEVNFGRLSPIPSFNYPLGVLS